MSVWPILTLAEAGVQLIDCVHKTPSAQSEGYPYVGIPQMKDGRLDFTTARRISSADYVEWTRKARPQRYDIVLSRRTNPGVAAPVLDDAEFALGQNLVLLRADGQTILPEFLRWLVLSPAWWEQVRKFNNVGAVFDSLKCADVPKFALPVPPVSVQATINEVLAALHDKVELNRRMNETLEAMVQAIFRDWFVDFGPVRRKLAGETDPLAIMGGLTLDRAHAAELALLFPDNSDEDGKPSGWSYRTIASVAARIAMGPFGSRITKDNFVTEGVPVIRGKNLADGLVDEEFVFLTPGKAEELSTSRAEVEDIVFTHRGTLGQVGRIFPGSAHPKYIASQSQLVLSVDRERTSPLFIYSFFRSVSGQNAWLSNAGGAGVPAIASPSSSLKAIEFLDPGMAIANAFDHIARLLEARTVAAVRESRTLTETREYLLPRLMSGKVRVTEIDASDQQARASGW